MFRILPASQRVAEDKWYLGTADAVTRTSTSSSLRSEVHRHPGRRPRLQDGLRADARSSTRIPARGNGRLHRGAPAWRRPASASWRSTETSGSWPSSKSRVDPPGNARQTRHRACQHGDLRVRDQAFLIEHPAPRRVGSARVTISGRTSSLLSSRNGNAVAHRFSESCVRSGTEADPYWRDVGTVDAFWEANVDLTDFTPALDLYDREWPIWTYAEITPPAKFVHDEDEATRHGDKFTRVRRLHNFRSAGRQVAAVHRGRHPLLRSA